MRYLPAILAISAAAVVSAPAVAADDIYVPVGIGENTIVLVQTIGDRERQRGKTHASLLVYYAPPSASLDGVPIRLTRTQVEIDCAGGASRRLETTAYSDLEHRMSSERYSEAWTPIASGEVMSDVRRLACVGLGPNDAIYRDLQFAVRDLEPTLAR